MTYVIDNLVEIAGKALENGEEEEMEEGFPSITETLEYLVDNDEIQPLELTRAFDKAKAKRQTSLKAPA